METTQTQPQIFDVKAPKPEEIGHGGMQFNCAVAIVLKAMGVEVPSSNDTLQEREQVSRAYDAAYAAFGRDEVVACYERNDNNGLTHNNNPQARYDNLKAFVLKYPNILRWVE